MTAAAKRMGEPERRVGKLLSAKRWTLAVAESCTGGRLAHRITAVPGSSAYFLGGVTAYADAVKTGWLGVDPRLLERDGAVSETVAGGNRNAVREASVSAALTMLEEYIEKAKDEPGTAPGGAKHG